MDSAYIELGFDHILDINGYDHILFVVALCAIYLISDWKKILILVTAFTIGHSLTLALSALEMVNISASLVETMIPVTIILTCIFNILSDPAKEKKSVNLNYALALVFGLIHGLGFSNYFKNLFDTAREIVLPLLGFNIGLELGQLIVVFSTLLLGYLAVNVSGLDRKYWKNGLSVIIMVWAFTML